MEKKPLSAIFWEKYLSLDKMKELANTANDAGYLKMGNLIVQYNKILVEERTLEIYTGLKNEKWAEISRQVLEAYEKKYFDTKEEQPDISSTAPVSETEHKKVPTFEIKINVADLLTDQLKDNLEQRIEAARMSIKIAIDNKLKGVEHDMEIQLYEMLVFKQLVDDVKQKAVTILSKF